MNLSIYLYTAVPVTAAAAVVAIYFTKSFVYYLFKILTQIKIHILYMYVYSYFIDNETPLAKQHTD